MGEFIQFKIPFETAATAVQVQTDEDPARTLAALDLPPYNGIVVVHGGASKMEEELVAAVRRFVVAGLAPLAEERRLLIVDGGTHSGASQLMGDARREISGTYPLLGVVPSRFVSYPSGPAPDDEHIPLNQAHTHFILVAGEAFGEESRLLVGLLRASGRPGVALIINGGEIVLKEANAHIEQRNLLVTVKGSGRIADCLADPSTSQRRALPPGARLWVVNLDAPEQCVRLLKTVVDSRIFMDCC